MKNLVGRFLPWLIGLALVGVSIPLAAYAYNGSFMRYSGDDYCYAAVQVEKGFWGMHWFSYNQAIDFHGNRYALTFFSGLAGLGPPSINGLLPGLAILLWACGLFILLRNLIQRTFDNIRRWELESLSLLSAVLLVFLTLYQTPDIKQSLYWRSGMLPYLAPLIGNTFLAYLILYLAGQKAPQLKGTLLIGLLALAIGGFSETGVAFQVAYLGLWLIVLIFLHKANSAYTAPVAVALIGSLLAFVLLAVSPALHGRPVSPPGNLLVLLGSTIRYTVDFTFSVIRSLILPTFFCLVVFISLGLLAGERLESRRPPIWRNWLMVAVAVIFICQALVFATMFPSVYAQSAYPEPRALLLAQFVVTVEAALLGLLGGLAVSTVMPKNGFWRISLSIACALGLLFAFAYPVYATRNILADTDHFQRWSRFWDQRDTEIRLARASGASEVHVVLLDHVIPRVNELSSDPSNWYNGCASSYYGIQILADLPGWEP